MEISPDDIAVAETTRNGGGVTGTSGANRDTLYPTRSDQVITPNRVIEPSRSPMYRTSQTRQIVISDPTATRTISQRNPINRGSMDRALSYQSTSGSNADNISVPYENPVPLDYPIEKLFRGFWNEPVKGSADKQGQFLYIPPASSQGSSALPLLLLAGAGVAAYFMYKKYKGGE